MMHARKSTADVATSLGPARQPALAEKADRLRHEFPIGNQAMLRRLSGTLPRVQYKLQVGAINDPLEAEADRVADEVMRMPDPGGVSVCPAPTGADAMDGGVGILHRKCAACEEEEEQKLSRKETGSAAALDGAEAPPIVHEVLNSAGQPLDPATRGFFEPRYGYDFRNVRVHADAQAAESAMAVRARAYTDGQDVVFGSGEYEPQVGQGRLLLAHELSHVVQQGSQPRRQGIRRQESGPRSVDPTALSDAELAAEYQRLLRASDPDEEATFEAVDAEIQRRASQSQQGPAQSSSGSTASGTPSIAAAGHAAGGPYHPPEGTELRCTMLDSCSALSLKINYLTHTIESHQAWDSANPDPAYPGGRHATEITELTNALNNCKAIYTTKCTNQPKFYPVPVAVPAAEEAAAAETTAAAAGTGEAVVGTAEAAEVGAAAAEGFELGDLAVLLLAL